MNTIPMPSKAGLALLLSHQHGYIWLEEKPESDWNIAQELVDCGYAQWGSYEEPQRENSRGIYITIRAMIYLETLGKEK